MHHFIFPTADSWITSGSNLVTGVTMKDQNFGQDEILELKKFYYNNSLDHVTRILINFDGPDLTALSKSVSDGTITNPKYFLKMYEAEGNKDLSTEYTITALPLSESWDEGVGKFGDIPKVTNGVSWQYRNNKPGATAIEWHNNSTATHEFQGGPSYISESGQQSGNDADIASQSISYQSTDIEMDVTSVVKNWFSYAPNKNAQSGWHHNYGFILRFSGSQESDTKTFGELKFFSKDTNTIYAPKLEVRWGDGSHSPGSLTSLDVTGSVDNYLYMRGLKSSYKENDRVKFRVGARKRYIQKTFDTSVQTITGSFIPADSGSYAIKDVATDEFIIPFSAYTTMSCDSTSNYFNQWLDGFYPDRVYKILLKLKYDDGQEQIFDDGFEFKIKR